MPASQYVPRLVVPKVHGDAAWETHPPELVVAGYVIAEKRTQRTLRHRGRSRVPVSEPRRQSLEQQIGRPWRTGRRRRGQRSLRHFRNSDVAGQAASELRCRERVKIGIPRQSHI
jgi:aminoglycoside phosphotransferase (APT) family kinase protein